MSIPVVCPHCGLRTVAARVYGGMTGPCRKCGAPLQVRNIDGRAGWILPLLAAMVIVLGACQYLGVFDVVPGRLSRLSTPDLRAPGDTSENLARIGLALRSYHRDYGQFPPAGIQENGEPPSHSWRVLLLPYLGMQELYDQYDFNEPWHSPRNDQVAMAMPGVFRAPGQPMQEPYGTPLVAVTGDGTAWDDAQGMPHNEINTRLARRPLVLDDQESRTPWTSPADLDATTLQFTAPSDNVLPPASFLLDRRVRFVRLLGGTSVSSERFLSTEAWSEFLGGQ
ncbi:DUF1559 family PulG-like putative transporter [Lignipirellula cremea]|uniref:DUF1559 domain-containing protein n=1 Tax=Lignipirellula cremea TaxID=2528010 RepID=A0A518DNG5_9BACT|nr:DUF1559 domain-containing protein [Lignipirellula cremea]QDU93380.1 hypothetical protein Pla8534_11600 [Lignipirellula cremea]